MKKFAPVVGVKYSAANARGAQSIVWFQKHQENPGDTEVTARHLCSSIRLDTTCAVSVGVYSTITTSRACESESIRTGEQASRMLWLFCLIRCELIGGAGENRTHASWFCRPLPYHLGTAPQTLCPKVMPNSMPKAPHLRLLSPHSVTLTH